MRNRKIGAHGPEVGVVGLGCMGMTYAYDMGSARDDETSISVIRMAIEHGMTLIDTADMYGPFDNEELVGRALRDGWRDRAIVATKVGYVVVPGSKTASNAYGEVVRNGRPEHIRRSIDGSLQRLSTDHVDLYQLHRVDPEVPIEESWGALAECVAAGKARHIGLSEVSVDQIRRAHAIHPVASVQSELSLWTRDALAEVVPFCETNGIGFLPFPPLGRGFLAGRFASFDDLPADDFRRSLPRFQQDALRVNLAIVGAVRSVADRLGVTPAQVAIAWTIAQGRYVVPIPGTKTPSYLLDNAASADVLLTPETLAELDAIQPPVGTRY